VYGELEAEEDALVEQEYPHGKQSANFTLPQPGEPAVGFGDL
jgi:hypothetical protein